MFQGGFFTIRKRFQ